MRVTVGILGLLALGVTVAVADAQSPRNGGAPTRRAKLLPPQPLHPSELPVIARAAAEELPTNPAMTPVPRPTAKSSAGGPGWLNGTDPNVRPASGASAGASGVRPLTPRPAGTKEDSFVTKGIEKLKSAFGPSGRPESTDRAPGNLPPGVAGVTANANTAFRGTTANGAPVYAGPPAYRWYGWGSVTPGANPHAPAGQYPVASANWYTITGSTPGAFPVPVMSPLRSPVGTEPPAYVTVPNQRIAPIGNTAIPTSRGTVYTPETMNYVPPPLDLSRNDPSNEPRITPTPTIAAPPPIVTPVMSPPPAAITAPQTTDREPPIRPLTNVTPLPALPEIKASELPPTSPSPLPVSVTEDQTNWQPRQDSRSPGDWGPAGGKPPSPATPPATNWQQPGSSSNLPAPSVARGQAVDALPDPAVALIRRLCAGRAKQLDVRWIGSNKLTVRFDCRSASEAELLVKAISARPELAPLQIDFSVVVK